MHLLHEFREYTGLFLITVYIYHRIPIECRAAQENQQLKVIEYGD